MEEPNTTQPLSTGQVAEYCRVDPRTVLRWVKRGQLKAFQLPGRGDHRIEQRDVLAFLKAHQMPIPIELGTQSQRVLVIEQDAALADGMQRALATIDEAEVRVAGNAFVAGALIERWRPQLLTLDPAMPGLEGAQVLRLIRADAAMRHVRVLAVSAMDRAMLDQLLEHGADAALPKPCDTNRLLAEASSLLSRPAQAG